MSAKHTRECRALLFVSAALLAGAIFCACVTTSGTAGGPMTTSVAVWDPEALGPIDATQAAMAEAMAARIVAHFNQSADYEVIERQNLIRLLEEQQLGSSDLADEQTRLRLGQIIGCRQMVFGAFQVIGNVMRLDIRAVDVSSGRVLKTAVATVPADELNGWLNAADQAATELMVR